MILLDKDKILTECLKFIPIQYWELNRHSPPDIDMDNHLKKYYNAAYHKYYKRNPR